MGSHAVRGALEPRRGVWRARSLLGLELGAPVGYLAGLAACAAVSLAGGDTLRKSAFGTAPLATLSAIAAGACWLSRVSRPTLPSTRLSMCRRTAAVPRGRNPEAVSSVTSVIGVIRGKTIVVT